jgi:hypothetical protein
MQTVAAIGFCLFAYILIVNPMIRWIFRKG